MAHFPDSGRKWPLGQTSHSVGLGDMDAKVAKSINGTTGDGAIGQSISEPTSVIDIGGEGIELQNEIAWNSAKTYTRKISPFRYCAAVNGNAQWQPIFGSQSGILPHVASQKLWIPLGPELIDGATIDQMHGWFFVQGSRPSQHITQYPSIWLTRRNQISGEVSRVGLGVFPTPAGGSDAAKMANYQNGGSPNVIVMSSFTAGHTVIDLSTYTYAFVFLDDNGPTSPYNLVMGFDVRMTNVTNQQMP